MIKGSLTIFKIDKKINNKIMDKKKRNKLGLWQLEPVGVLPEVKNEPKLEYKEPEV